MFASPMCNRGDEIAKILDVMSQHGVPVTEGVVVTISKIVCNYQDNQEMLNEYMPQIMGIFNLNKTKEENTDA